MRSLKVWNYLSSGITPKQLPPFSLRSWLVAGVILSLSFLVTPLSAEKGQSFYKQGRDLEARQNYEGAFDEYERAYDANPRNTQYRAALTRIRFLAAAAKVHRATLLVEAGEFEKALALFEDAAKIDPSSPIAAQQAANTRNMIQQASGGRAEGTSQTTAELSPEIMDAQGPVKLSGISSPPVTLKMTEDAKMIYQTIEKLAGVN